MLRSEAQTLMESAASAGAPLPRYVQDELHASLRCGVLACGFARARCPDCGRDKLVAFSCKKRGVCPSCGGRRMSETAAELVTRVVPEVPVRQWVLSLPWALRLPVARDSALLTKVARIFFEAIREHLRAKVGGHGPGERVEVGAVTFVQRFGGALNLNPHLHVLVADGAFVCPEDGRAPRFVSTVAPMRAEMVEVLRGVATRVARITTVRADDGLDALRAAAMARGTVARLPLGDDAGGEELRFEARQRGVEHAGFNLHAGVCVAADDRVALERLCRYVARPAVCGGRVEQLEDGRVAYRLKHPRQGGETHRVMTGQEFMARLVALIPPPRSPLVRYHGVFAPHSPWRAVVVPGPRRPHHRDDAQRVGCGHDGIVVADGDHVEGNLPVRPPSAGVAAVQQIALTTWDWATLLKRVWGFDALTCTGCGGRMRFIAVIKDRAVIERILKHLGEDAEEPKFARARDPCDLWA
ncbi:MAG: transposase [Deltaproteobacteria bacterium]|nr:transposase [Deltaproteobacteria bacterium]